MFRRPFFAVWMGILALSALFLAGQQAWPPCTDEDGDGFGLLGSPFCPYPEMDCDDSDPDVHPGAPELCDGKDNQCPGDPGYGQVDEGCQISPAPGSTLAGTSQAFLWSQGLGSLFEILAGPTPGSDAYYRSGELQVNEATVGPTDTYPGLPVDGSEVWVRLRCFQNGWQELDFAYTAALFTRIFSPDTHFIDAEPADGMDEPGPILSLPGHRVIELAWSRFDDPDVVEAFGIDIGAAQGGFEYDTSRPSALDGQSAHWAWGASQQAVVPADGTPVWIRLWYKPAGDPCTLYQDCPHTDHQYSAPDEAAATDLVLASISMYDSDLWGHQVEPAQLFVRKGHRARLMVTAAVINEASGGETTFDLGGTKIRVSGQLVQASGPAQDNEDDSFSVVRALDPSPFPRMQIVSSGGGGGPSIKTLTLASGVKDAGLFFADRHVLIPEEHDRMDYEVYVHPFDGQNPPDLASENPPLRRTLLNQLPDHLAFIQHAFNNHRNNQDAYVLDYVGEEGVSVIVFTIDVNVEHLVPGLWDLLAEIDPDDDRVELREGNNDRGVHHVEIGPMQRKGYTILDVLFSDELSRYLTCLDEDPAPSVLQPATYIYEVFCEGGDYWTEHLQSFDWNGVDENTADEMVVGEVWGPFGTGCEDYTGGEGPSGSCNTWTYSSSTSVTCDDPGTCWGAYDQVCDPEDTLTYAGCVAALRHFVGRPNPSQIRNVMIFFPGVLGANGGSGFTGQFRGQGTQNDFDGDNNKILRPFKKTSFMGRIFRGQEDFGEHPDCPYDRHPCGQGTCGNCYGPDNTLLVGVWDTAIDTTETKDREIIKGLEEMVALRTNLYENVERVWIVGGSRGGSTATYLMSRIVGRFKGTFTPRLPYLGPRLHNRIYRTGVDIDGNDRDKDALRFVVAGIPPISMTNDPDSYYRRLVNYYWGAYNPPGWFNAFYEAGHANGHDVVSLFAQTGDNIWALGDRNTPFLAVFSTGDSSGYDPILHVRGDNGDDEAKARFPVNFNWDYCDWDANDNHGHPADDRCSVWHPELDSYIYPMLGPYNEGEVGNFYSVMWPLKEDGGEWRRYAHDELTRDWTPFHSKFVDWMFQMLYGMLFNGGDPDMPPEVICSNIGNVEFGCYDLSDDDFDCLIDCDDPDCFDFYNCQ